MRIDSDFFKYFNWGFSFNRINSFNRRYQGGYDTRQSITNHIADNLNDGNWIDQDLSVDNYDGNIYYDCSAPWLGILAYQSYLVNGNLRWIVSRAWQIRMEHYWQC